LTVAEDEAVLKISADVQQAVQQLQNVAKTLDDLKGKGEGTGQGVATASKLMQVAFNEASTGIILGTRNLSGAFDAFGLSITRQLGNAVLNGLTPLTLAISGVVTVAAGMVAKGFELAESYGQAAQAITNAAVQTSLSVGMYQRVTHAVEAAGIEGGRARISMMRFAISVEEAARSGGRGALVFQDMGVRLRDSNGRLRDTDSVLRDFAAAIGRIEDPARRVSVANEMLGRGGAALIPIFKSLGVEQAAGIVLTDEMVAAGVRFDSEWSAIKLNISGVTNTMLAWLTTALTPALKAVRDLSTGLRDVAAATLVWGDAQKESTEDFLAAHRDQIPGAVEATPEQQKRAIESRLMSQVAANEAIAIAAKAHGDERGALVATQAAQRLQQTAKRDNALLAAAKELGIRQVDIEKSTNAELQSIRDQYATEDKALAERQGAERQALQMGLGARITEAEIAGRRKTAEALLGIEKAEGDQRRALGEISAVELIDIETKAGEERFVIQQTALNERMRLDTLAVDERRKITLELESIEAERTTFEATQAAKRTAAQVKETETYRTMANTVGVLVAGAYGDTHRTAILQLTGARDKLLDQLQKEPNLWSLIGPAVDAYSKKIREAEGVTINFRDTAKSAIVGVTNAFMGMGKIEDVFKNLAKTISSKFTEGFAEALLQKTGFEGKLTLNAKTEMPEVGSQLATGLGKPLAGLWNWLKGGGTSGAPGFSVDAIGALSGAGTQGVAGGGLAPGAGVTLAPGGLAALGGGGGGGGGGSILGGISSLIGGIGSLFGGGAGGAGAAAGGAGAAAGGAGAIGAVPIIGWAILAAQVIIGAVQGARKVVKAAQTALWWNLDDMLKAGAASFPIIGSIGAALPKELRTAAGMSLFFRLPSMERRESNVIAKMLTGAGIPVVPGLKAGHYGRSATETGPIGIEDLRNWPAQYAKVAAGTIEPEQQRGSAEALGWLFAGSTPRPDEFTMRFTNMVINNARAMRVTAKETRHELLQLAEANKVDLPSAMEYMRKSLIESSQTQEEYNKRVEGLLKLFVDMNPKIIETGLHLADVSETIGGNLIVNTEDAVTALQSLKQALVTIAGSSVQDALSSLIKDPNEILRQEQDIHQTEKRIDLMNEQIRQARQLGDEVSAASLEMNRAGEIAQVTAQRSALAALDPGKAFMDAIKMGLENAIVTAIVDAVVKAETIQVLLAPVIAAVTHAAKVIADPSATSQMISEAISGINLAYNAAAPGIQAFQARLPDLETALLPTFGLISGFPTARLGSQAGGGQVVNINITGNTIADDQSVERLAHHVGNALNRQVKHNTLLGR